MDDYDKMRQSDAYDDDGFEIDEAPEREKTKEKR